MAENTRRGTGRQQVREGMDVLDQNGEKIGKAGETLGGGRYFNVDAGILGIKEYYVPMDAVREVRGDAVYVNVTKDRLGQMGWHRRPDEQTTRGAGVDSADRETLQLREEELQARKQQVETGRVRIGTDVAEEQRKLEVPVTREEVTIERQRVERRPADAPINAAESETIRVPVREERVEVEKTPVVYEEVNVGKRNVRETRQVSDTVRREEARVEQQGEVQVRGWDEAMPRYRDRWQKRSQSRGRRWEDAEPGYRYGWELRNDPRYRGRAWSDVQSDVERDWTTGHPDTPWEGTRDSVRDAWEVDS